MNPDSHHPKKLWLYGTVIIAVALIMRLLSLGTYPLMDTSEARYGEMVRLMVETNDWITPYFDYDVPFWGKPPLFIWMSAISFKLFGINEFAARLPSLLASIGTLWLTWKLTSFQLNQQAGKLAILILTTSAMFLVLSGRAAG
ncbi:ArnT family glycosyltransferase [Endozoicomonas lisbonensis]|uniref:ArnT family glycosyltransferase n=1 Tax=Endozoicomonas lisbonensis TaxID=3120522 RepID=UPI0033919EE3